MPRDVTGFFPLILSVLILATTSATARLNETRLDLSQRFGPPVSEKRNQHFGSTEYTFRYEGWTIRAYLINGSCAHITYALTSARLTDAQVAALMESNGDGHSWSRDASKLDVAQLIMPSYTLHTFVRSDGGASCTKGSSNIAFSTRAWLELEPEKKAQRAAAKAAVPQF